MGDGLSIVQARIAAIQQQMKAVQPQAPVTTNASPSSDFAQILQTAQASTTTASYENGRFPTSALVSIGNGESLTAPAADAFKSLQAAAQASGINFQVNDSYRSYQEQVQVAKEKGLYSKGGLAAVPGTSTHGLGLSVDLELDAKAQSWMRANANRYGFVNDVRGESWHWTYKP